MKRKINTNISSYTVAFFNNNKILIKKFNYKKYKTQKKALKSFPYNIFTPLFPTPVCWLATFFLVSSNTISIGSKQNKNKI